MALTDPRLLDPAPFEVWIALRSQKGSGTLNDPYGIASTSDFDTLMTTLMSSFPNGTTIHLSPGEFTTAGYTDGPPVAGWQIKPKIRILGSGRKGDPGGDADATPVPKYGRLWQVRRLVIENNIIELAPSLSNTIVPSFGIDVNANVGLRPIDPYVFRHVLVRGNIIRMADNRPDSNAVGIGISICENALIEGNILSELARPVPIYAGPIHQVDCGVVQGFNNRASTGKLVRVFNRNTNQQQDELETEIEETLLLALARL